MRINCFCAKASHIIRQCHVWSAGRRGGDMSRKKRRGSHVSPECATMREKTIESIGDDKRPGSRRGAESPRDNARGASVRSRDASLAGVERARNEISKKTSAN